MLVRAEQYKFIEKTITTRSGRIVSVLVAVSYYEDRVISARIVAVRPIQEPSEAYTESVLLTSNETASIVSSVVSSVESKRSPYFDFSFFVSQPTRAPAFN